MFHSDDDLDEIINLEFDEDNTSADKPSSKAEPGPSSWPCPPRPTTRNIVSLVAVAYFNVTYRISIKL